MKSNISYEEAQASGDLADYADEDDEEDFPLSGYNGNDTTESGDINGE